MSVCDLIAAMVFEGKGENDERDPRLQLVQEPAVGTGRMLLSASNYSYRLFGQDIDQLVLDICLINGAFYAPWLTFPFPDSIVNPSLRDQAHESAEETEPLQLPAPKAA